MARYYSMRMNPDGSDSDYGCECQRPRMYDNRRRPEPQRSTPDYEEWSGEYEGGRPYQDARKIWYRDDCMRKRNNDYDDERDDNFMRRHFHDSYGCDFCDCSPKGRDCCPNIFVCPQPFPQPYQQFCPQPNQQFCPPFCPQPNQQLCPPFCPQPNQQFCPPFCPPFCPTFCPPFPCPVYPTGATGATGATGEPGASGLAAFGYVYDLATIVNGTTAVIAGGADVPFSTNGPLLNIAHAPGAAPVVVLEAGTYQIDYQVNITAGIGAQIAIAVNDAVNPATPISVLVAAGVVSGTAIKTLAAGDIVTLRNDSLVALTLALAPSVGAQMNLIKLD